MLDIPQSMWLPLQPLPPSSSSSSVCDNHRRRQQDEQDERALPGGSCSIEALRDTFAPLYYYHPPASTTARTAAAAAAAARPIITQASTRDLPALLKLHSSSLPLKYDPSFFISLLLNANYIVLVASDNNAITACATAFFNPYLHELELLTLCVDQRHKRNGLASALLQEIANRTLETCRKDSFTAILRVQTTNKPAINLYTRLGFTIEAMEANYYKGCLSGTSAAYKMKKLISREL